MQAARPARSSWLWPTGADHCRLNSMDQTKTALERAFDLARSGRFARASEIVQVISKEGYSASQLEGPSLRRQLNALIKEARATGADRTGG